MIKIVGVRFRTAGKVYYFGPKNLELKIGDRVIVETARGVEMGTVAVAPKEVPDDEVVQPLKTVQRIATEEDFKRAEKNKEKEKEAFKICQEKIKKHKLEMKLVDAEYTFDNNKLLFYFTADGRIDFRELVKDLASVFRTRIELRQIGVRDETKISGVCGRLMCCLKNEQETYEYLNSQLPNIGDYVTTPEGIRGQVKAVSVLRQRVKVLIEQNDTKEERDYAVGDLKFKAKRKNIKVTKEELKELAKLEDNK